MIAVDSNILIYGHRRDSAWHRRADACLARLIESGLPWALPWPCIHEFLAIVTHSRVYRPPTPLDRAIAQVEAWLDSPTVAVLGEGRRYWSALRRILEQSAFTGPRVHDARIAALCLHHGVTELWTADRDFRRFPDLKIVNPLTDD